MQGMVAQVSLRLLLTGVASPWEGAPDGNEVVWSKVEKALPRTPFPVETKYPAKHALVVSCRVQIELDHQNGEGPCDT